MRAPFTFLAAGGLVRRVTFLLFALGAVATAPAQLHHWRADHSGADEAGPLTASPTGGVAYLPGVGGQAWGFDGVDDRVTLGGTPLAPPWTASAWVRREDAPGQSASLLNDAATALKLEQWPGTRKVGFTQFGVGDWSFNYTAPADRWVHLTLVAVPGSTSLYADGVLVGQLAVAVNLPRAFIGGAAGDRLKGRVDELKIWDRALTATEIAGEASVQRVIAHASAPREQSHTVPNVIGAFNSLTARAEALGFRMAQGVPIAEGNLANEDSRKAHYQGIQRWERTGSVPYLFVSRSGQDIGKGNLLVVRLGSRNAHGERLRSNRLAKGPSVNETAPPPGDGVVSNLFFDYEHLGSMQLCGDILAIALEDRVNDDLPVGRVAFYNVANPETPVLLPVSLDLTHKVGVVGLTKLADGRFLLVMTWGENERVKFYRSNHTSFFTPGFQFEFHTELTAAAIPDFPSGQSQVHQALDLLTQDDGRVFMVGGYNTSSATPILNGDDILKLYEISNWQTPGAITVQALSSTHKYCSTFGGTSGATRAATADVNADFLAGVGTYVSPSGELLVYACEHWNDGPGRTVRFVEFHHHEVIRPDSPLRMPQAVAGGPYRVVEGSTITLSSALSQPVRERPWIQLFDDDGFGGSSVIIDWDDFFLEDYDDFRDLEWNDKASSLRYFVPPAHAVVLHDADNFQVGENEPTLRLETVPRVGTISNLSAEPWEFDNQGLHETRVTSVRFLGPPAGHAARLDQPLGYGWFLPEVDAARARFTSGAATASPRFEAVEGPLLTSAKLIVSQTGPFGTFAVPVATRSDTTEVVIEIVNAAPVFSYFSLEPLDGPGSARVRVDFGYKDPGVLDTHTIQIHWGDGTSESFVGAAGGSATLQRDHTYLDTDPTAPLDARYTVTVTVTDDDGASVSETDDHIVRWRTTASTVDRDGDGLPDYWESQRLLTRVHTGAQDTDGDGFTNRQEYDAGTNPLVAAESPGLTIFATPGGGGTQTVQFTARAVTGHGYGTYVRRYRLETATNLAGAWTTVPGYEAILGAGQTVTYVAPGTGTRFFRAVAWLE